MNVTISGNLPDSARIIVAAPRTPCRSFSWRARTCAGLPVLSACSDGVPPPYRNPSRDRDQFAFRWRLLFLIFAPSFLRQGSNLLRLAVQRRNEARSFVSRGEDEPSDPFQGFGHILLVGKSDCNTNPRPGELGRDGTVGVMARSKPGGAGTDRASPTPQPGSTAHAAG